MKRRILIAEDEKTTLISLAMALEWQGHLIRTAQSGDVAQDMIMFMCRIKQKPDLLICDINLPVLGGEELIANIRQSGIDIPVIAITSKSDRELEERLIELGCVAIVKKPFSQKMLLENIKHLFAQKYLKKIPIKHGKTLNLPGRN